MTNIVGKISKALKLSVPICCVSVECVLYIVDSVTNLHYDISPYENLIGIEIVSLPCPQSLRNLCTQSRSIHCIFLLSYYVSYTISVGIEFNAL